MQLLILERADLTAIQLREIFTLKQQVWPKGAPDINGAIKRFLDSERPEIERHVLVIEEGALRGYAKFSTRFVTIGSKIVHNMALASVCVDPNYRGAGVGSRMVRNAFGHVDNGTFDCSFFQTGVPGFYEKLGARRVVNRFYNSLNGDENPWWDPYVMLYPASYPLSGEPIDLMGKGY